MDTAYEKAISFMALVLVLLVVETFVESLIAEGCSLTAALTAASAVGVVATEISGRFGGGSTPPTLLR